MYNTYYLNGSINADCLGILKYFFCADAFPVCVAESGDQKYVYILCIVKYVIGYVICFKYDVKLQQWLNK